MEVVRHLIMIAIVTSLQFAPTCGDIIVQPGYGETSSSSAKKLETPVQQQPKLTTTLNDEIKRYQSLQQLLQAQVFHLMNNGQGQNLQELQQLQQLQQPSILGLPLIRGFYPNLLPHPLYAGAHLHPLTYSGIGGLNIGGFPSSPFNLGAPAPLSNYIDRNADDGSTTDGSRSAARLGQKLHAVATQPAVEESKLDSVVELPVPENNLDETSIHGKQVEARHISGLDDVVVGSPLDKIRYHQSKHQQHNLPINVEGMRIITSRTMEQKIDDTIPLDANLKCSANKVHEEDETNYKNKDPEPVINANIDKESSQDRSSAIKSQNGERVNLKSTSKTSNQSFQNAKAFDNAQTYQPIPMMSNGMMMKNWMTEPRHLHSIIQSHHLSDIHAGYPPRYLPGHQPNYPPVIQPNYPPTYQSGYQPGYQPLDYHGQPGTGNYQPYHGSGGGSSTSYATSGPNGSSASSSSTSNRNNEYNPYRSIVVKNPNVSWQPYSATRFVDQFGRAFIVARPLNSNPMVGNLNGYVKNIFEPQIAQVYQQPRYWYNQRLTGN